MTEPSVAEVAQAELDRLSDDGHPIDQGEATMQPPARTIEKRKASALKVRPQVRKTFPPDEDLLALASSVKRRQIHPLILRHGGGEDTILDGECRWRGMMLLDPEFEFDVLVVDRDLTPAEVTETQLVSAMHSTSLPPYDQAVAAKEWFALNPDATVKDLAVKLDRDPSTLLRLNSLWKTTPAVQRAAAEGRIGPKAWYQISLLPAADRDGLLEMHLSGMSATRVESIRKSKTKPVRAVDTVKLSRVTCSLTGGVKVTVAGDGIDLEGLIEALTSALDAAKKANKESLDVRTFEKVLRDKSRAV